MAGATQLEPSLDPAAEPSRFSGHMPTLDGIRGLAILAVTLYRFNIGPAYDDFPGNLLFGVLGHGDLGVDLFFVLSGFLITGILFDAKQHAYYFRNFYVRRALRIFPLYYGFLLVMLVVLPFAFGSRGELFPEATENQAWLWTYCANFLMGIRNEWCLGSFEHFWSLAIEEQFYLVWPLLILLCSRRQAMIASLAAVAFSILGRIVWIRSGGGDAAVELFTFFRFDGLGLGAFLALYVRGPAQCLPPSRWARVSVAGCAAGVVGAILLERRLWGLNLALVAGFCAALLILALASTPDSRWGRLWRSRALAFFGKYSYAMYVFQLPLIVLMAPILTAEGLCASLGSVFLGRMTYIALMTSVTTACAYLSWHLYEKHFLKLKRYFPT